MSNINFCYRSMNDTTLNEKIEFLRENPIFWSRFGHELDNPEPQKNIINAGRHKALWDKGIYVHSSILPSGWIAPDTYDYSELDALLELLFTTCPNIVYFPRIKLNVPEGWCAAHPEDVFVYAGGPRTKEEISELIGTDVHGSHPPKPTDILAQQSFSSPQWLSDASEALRRLVLHIEGSKWSDRIIGYHIAYGTCGETTQWGTWDNSPAHKGDYGISATKAFLKYAADRGYSFDDIPPVEKRFYINGDTNTTAKYHFGTPTLDELFYHKDDDLSSVIYSEFTKDMNADAAEAFGKVVKDIVPNKVTGIFFGYIAEPKNCANTQHTGFERILNSPYIDFLAGPKGYHRVGATDPGFGQCVPNSVTRKKLWVDEIDNRTHLCKTNNHKDYTAKNFDQTRAVYWREFTKNTSHRQGYWWMDLMGGWLDSEEIQNEIALLSKTSQELYKEDGKHKGVAEVLAVIDEDVMHRMRPNFELHEATICHTGSTFKECGVPMDLYRMADLGEIDLSGYKVVIFMNAFYVSQAQLSDILSKFSPDCHIIWNYTAGILNKDNGSFDIENVRKLTGFSLSEYPREGGVAEESFFPAVYVSPKEEQTALALDDGQNICLAKRRATDGRIHIINAMPALLTVERARELLADAGVHFYAPPYCAVNCDNRFIYVLAERKMRACIELTEKKSFVNVFTGERYKDTANIELDMEEGTCVFFKYE